MEFNEYNESAYTETQEISEQLITEAEEKAKLWENKYKYLCADFDNFKKQTNKRVDKLEKTKHKDLILKLLDVIDNCERSFAYDRTNQPIYDQLLAVLFADGLTMMDIHVGDKFNEEYMNAVGVTPPNSMNDENNTISVITKNGYIYKGEVIRFADVMVCKVKGE